MRKIFYLFAFILPFGLVSCTDNGDEPDPTPPPAVLDVVNADNVIGEWQVYYATKLIRLNPQDPNQALRDISYDGYRISIKKSGSDVLYQEYNADQKLTANGKVIEFRGDTAMVFRGWVKNGTRENPDTTIFVRPYMTKANQYMKITSVYYGHTSSQNYQITDRKFFRNQLNSESKDRYPDVAIKNLIDNEFLVKDGGKWEVTSYSKNRRDAQTNALHALSDEEKTINQQIYNTTTKKGAEYWFGSTPSTSMAYRSWNSDGRETTGGTYRIYDDVIDMFYINDKGEEDAAGLMVTGRVTATSPNSFTEETKNYKIISGLLYIDTKNTTFRRMNQ